MVLNVGLVSACIVYKNRAGAETRLQKLQRKLKQKNLYQKILYSHPIKKIFSILIILCFMSGLVLFLKELHAELNIKYQVLNLSPNNRQHAQNLYPYRPQIGHFLKTLEHNHTDSALLKSISDHHQYLTVQTTVCCLLLFFALPLVILVSSLEFQRVIVKTKSFSQANDISGHIQKQKFSPLTGWTHTNQFICTIDDTFLIQLCGQTRFTNTNFYYAIKKITKPKIIQGAPIKPIQSSNSPPSDPQNVTKINQQVIMQKGNIYEARQALIYLCHVLKKNVDLRIKNGPVKQKKQYKRQSTQKKDKQKQ